MKPILAACAAFVAGDFIWLSLTAPLYRRALPFAVAAHPQWAAAAAFYLLYLVGLMVFCLRPYLRRSWQSLVGHSVLFGLVAYGTYDLTNQAILAGWPTWITLADMAWGATLSSLACSVGWWVGRRFS